MRQIQLAVAVAGLMASSMALGQAPAVTPAQAAPPTPGMAGEVQASYARIKANIVKAAEKMPAENYQFKPTPEVRAFARVVNHVTEAQARICGAANHTAETELIKSSPENADKAAVVQALMASFAECDKAYASLTTANAADMLDMGAMKRSRLGLLWGNVSHDNEQYATLALYMRLKGLVPPTSEK